MAKVTANGIQLEYDTFGDKTAQPLLLIMGLGSQMILWDPDFCQMLADRGHYVVRFDNRDIGLSTKFDEAGVPDVMQMFIDGISGKPLASPYSLDDMADDTAGLMDALDIEQAHVFGVSMGGMIAQVLAYRHPERLKTVTLSMTTTGDPSLPVAKPEVLSILAEAAPTDREDSIQRSFHVWRTIGSPAFPIDDEMIRRRAGEVYDRSQYREGQPRQLAAVLAHGSRREKLKDLQVPTLVIHGDSDPLIPVDGGKDLAAVIPDAKLLIIEGMGHDNPPPLWPRIIDAISEHTLG